MTTKITEENNGNAQAQAQAGAEVKKKGIISLAQNTTVKVFQILALIGIACNIIAIVTAINILVTNLLQKYSNIAYYSAYYGLAIVNALGFSLLLFLFVKQAGNKNPKAFDKLLLTPIYWLAFVLINIVASIIMVATGILSNSNIGIFIFDSIKNLIIAAIGAAIALLIIIVISAKLKGIADWFGLKGEEVSIWYKSQFRGLIALLPKSLWTAKGADQLTKATSAAAKGLNSIKEQVKESDKQFEEFDKQN